MPHGDNWRFKPTNLSGMNATLQQSKKITSPGFLRGLVNRQPYIVNYFRRSNVFCRISQSFIPLTFSCEVLMMFASFAFFVALALL